MGSIADLWKYLEATEKVGWVAFLFGWAFLLAIAYGVWPFEAAPVEVALIAALIAMIGTAIVVVNRVAAAVEWNGKRRARNAEAKAKEAAAEAEKTHKGEAVKNLVLLESHGIEQLVWLLRRNQQRFSYSSVLPTYRVAHRIGHDRIFEIDEAVWHQREALLQKYAKVRDMPKFPETRFVA